MPTFRNTLERALRVEIGDLAHEIPAGGVVEIPARLAYVVAARGLPLVPCDAPPTARAENLREPPAGVEQLPAQDREGFLGAWRDAVTLAQRNELVEALRRRLAALADGDDGEDDDEEPEATNEDDETSAPPPAPTLPESSEPADDVEAQIAAASAAVGRSRRRTKE